MTQQPAADGHLPAARKHLDHAISALIDPKRASPWARAEFIRKAVPF